VQLFNEWRNVMACLEKYPHIIKPETNTRQVFFKLYAQVCTRCFGWGLPHTSMVPMADNCNHSDVTVVQELINNELHAKVTPDSKYYTRSKFMNNVAECFEGDVKTEELMAKLEGDELKEVRSNLEGRFDRELYEENVSEYGPEAWKKRAVT